MFFTKYLIAGKDYIHIDAADIADTAFFCVATKLCDRINGVGADGIFTFNQNDTKNAEISGLLQNGQIMRDFSSASICACFDTFLNAEVFNSAFSFKNEAISEINCGFSENNALISCRFLPYEDHSLSDCISRRTEIGNRILTVTPIYLCGIHGVHFTGCKNQLNINYLGLHFSKNSIFDKRADFILAQRLDQGTYEIDFYENGTGCPRPTLSAFIAVALAAIKTGQNEFGNKILVKSADSTVSVICRSDTAFEIVCKIRKIFEGSI